MKRGLFVIPGVALALWLSTLSAAAAEWCSNDPAIHFVNAGGHPQTVYLTTYGEGVEHAHAVSAVVYSYGTRYGDHGRKTQLKFRVFVPDDSRHHFHVRWVVSTGPDGTGTILARHDGNSGQGSNFDFETAG